MRQKLINSWSLLWISDQAFLERRGKRSSMVKGHQTYKPHSQHTLMISSASLLEQAGKGISTEFSNYGTLLLKLPLDVPKWCPAVYHLVENTAQRPDVTGLPNLKAHTKLLAAEFLWNVLKYQTLHKAEIL